MTTSSSIFVTHGDEEGREEPFTVKMALRRDKSDAARVLRQFCKARNGKRSPPIDAAECVLALDEAGTQPLDGAADVRFLVEDEGVAFVVPKPKPKPPAYEPKRGFLAAAPPRTAAAAASPPKKAVAKTKLKKGFLNSGGLSTDGDAASRAPAAKTKVDDETYSRTPSIQLRPGRRRRDSTPLHMGAGVPGNGSPLRERSER